MATPMPTPNCIVIWLDQHIGELESNKQLKKGIGEHVDPEKVSPEVPSDQTTMNGLIQFKTNYEQCFNEIPNNLKAFSDENQCLQCIDESLKKNLKIFLITSGKKGEVIAPKIIDKYSILKTIYVFCGHCPAHVKWMNVCLEHEIVCIVIEHHLDLLVRLLRDVAEHFIDEGEKELTRSEQYAYSAISYFNWAKLLFQRANTFAKEKVLKRIKHVEGRIEFVEELIKKSNGNNDERESKETTP